jgi:hypothetical protein
MHLKLTDTNVRLDAVGGIPRRHKDFALDASEQAVHDRRPV